MKRIFLLLMAILYTNQAAQAAYVSVVGALNSSEPKVPGVEYEPRSALGAGILFEAGLAPFIGLEIGALYLPREYQYSTVGVPASHHTVKHKMWQFPLMLRARLGSVFSLGIGGYYGKYAEEAYTTETTTGNQTTASTATYSQANHSKTDYGFITGAAFHIPLAPLTRIIVDARYTMGIKDNNTGAGETKYNDMQLLAGLRFGF